MRRRSLRSRRPSGGAGPAGPAAAHLLGVARREAERKDPATAPNRRRPTDRKAGVMLVTPVLGGSKHKTVAGSMLRMSAA